MLRDGSLKNATCARGINRAKRVEGEISIVQSIQLGFKRLLGKRS